MEVKFPEYRFDERKICIGFIIDTMSQAIAGTEAQLRLLIRSINQSLFDPTLFVFSDSDRLPGEEFSIPIYSMGTSSPLRPKSWTKIYHLSKDFRERKIQIVHTFFRDANIAGVIAARLAKVPIVVSSRRNKGYWHNRKEIMFLKFLNHWVTRFLANSEDVRQYTHAAEGVPLEKIDVIYNGVDVDKFQPKTLDEQVSARKQLGLLPDALIGIIVANLRPVKGIDVLINALPDVVKVLPNFVLLIIGEGDERAKLEDLMRIKGAEKNVRFFGTRTDVPFVLSVCDLGVLSSHSESLSNSIIEYMASSLPVVATDVGGTREMVKHGENGFLVQAGDSQALTQAMISLLKDPDLRLKMGTEGRKRAEKMFNLERYIKEHEEYYMRLVELYGSK